MAGNVVNLRQARKRKRRADKDAKADEARRLHGLSKAEKTALRSEKDKSVRHLDGHRLGGPTEGPEDGTAAE